MRLQSVAPRRGAQWVRQGFRVFAKYPVAFAALFAAFLFGVFVLLLLPFGSVLVIAALPLVSLGFMIATRLALGQTMPTPRVFVEPLRGERATVVAMVQLGAAYVVATLAVMGFSNWADGGAFEALLEAMQAGRSAPDEIAARLAAPGLPFGIALRFGLAGLLSVPFWHAPALAHWHRQGTAQALFSSTVACWRNRGAFAVYGVTWFGLIVLVGVLGGIVFPLLGLPQLFALAAAPLSLLLSTVFYASLYFTFADSFVDGDAPALAAAA